MDGSFQYTYDAYRHDSGDDRSVRHNQPQYRASYDCSFTLYTHSHQYPGVATGDNSLLILQTITVFLIRVSVRPAQVLFEDSTLSFTLPNNNHCAPDTRIAVNPPDSTFSLWVRCMTVIPFIYRYLLLMHLMILFV
jgi:hypothetical protein